MCRLDHPAALLPGIIPSRRAKSRDGVSGGGSDESKIESRQTRCAQKRQNVSVTSSPTSFDALSVSDIPRLVKLNDDASPAVPITSEAEMATLLETAGFTLAARDRGTLIGFVIGMRAAADYASENYRFFAARSSDFLYVDRIVIDASRRGAGTGRALYSAVFELARDEGLREVTCEVNLDPPNPESLAFHARMGFERVGEQETKNGSVTVALLAALV
jgi:predicted GNAT superfamily acetyltransferase